MGAEQGSTGDRHSDLRAGVAGGSQVGADGDSGARHETPTEQLDRNWTDLLQELRVVQTGVQLLTGFLLTLPFQARFAQLSSFERNDYLFTVACSVGATAVLITPVGLHRLLFHRHERRAMVAVAHRLTLVGLLLLGGAIVGVVLLVFTFVAGDGAGQIAAAIAGGTLLTLWLLGPIAIRTKTPPESADQACGRGPGGVGN